MKRTIRQGLVLVALAASGLAISAPRAFAQAAPADATVNFTGTVGSVCLFSNTVNGTLVQDGPSLTSGPPTGGPPGASVGFVDLDCTGSVDISVSLPQDNGSTTDLLSGANFYDAFLEVGTGGGGPFASHSFSATGGTNSNSTGFIPGPISETLSVSMFIDVPGSPPEGAYNYNVVVTAAPQ